ncbi:MAG: hypothetical protein MI723_08445 [Caulobacterales bacterium]|nr:hypothetical protein [Caulobacterales bacterium]
MVAAVFAAGLAACATPVSDAEPAGDPKPKTGADRSALFDHIVATIMASEAFSPAKNARFGVSYPDAFEALREEFIAAESDEELFYAIVRLSNARNDRHLSVSQVDGGLLAHTEETEEAYGPYSRGCRVRPRRGALAPVRFSYEVQGEGAEALHAAESAIFFVSEFAAEFRDLEDARHMRLGDRVVAVNGRPVEDYVAAVRPYHCNSTPLGHWRSVSEGLNLRGRILPPWLYEERLDLTLRRGDDAPYTVSLPYYHWAGVTWADDEEPAYAGFSLVMSRQNFNVFVHEAGAPALIIEWLDFEDELLDDVDALMAYAVANDMLGHDIILDARPSSGGSRGPYAIQRLTSKPFKTTFGNLRVSDISTAWAEEAMENLKNDVQQMDGDSPELVGDPQWLLDWLEEDFRNAAEAGLPYTNNVPFKSAHAPKWHYGVLEPAPVHFTGDMVCIFGPAGGSHVDQMAAILKDNGLCPMIGMPAGGFSNTWEGRQVLTWPGTDEPVVEFMWNIGHTIRPNGEILEGNPAEMDEYLPITRANHQTYRDDMITRAMDILGVSRDPASDPAS